MPCHFLLLYRARTTSRPARSWSDLIEIAEIAHFWAAKSIDGDLLALADGHCAPAKLIAAVLVGAVAIVPVVAAASGVHRLTPIQALWEQYRTIAATVAQLSIEQDAAWERRKAQSPQVPDELVLSHYENICVVDDDDVPGLVMCQKAQTQKPVT